MFAFQDSRSELRSTKVKYAFVRDDQELKGCDAKMHPELFGYLNEIPKSLGEFRRVSGKAKLSAEILTSKEMTDLRRELADSQMQRQVAAGLKPVRSAIQVDHGVPCWTTRSGLQQLFGPRRLEEEELDDADALWVYEKAKKLHNSDLNARAMTEVSHRMLPPCAAAAAASLLSTATKAGAPPGVHPAVGPARPRAQDG